jgi:glycosyltransferase involved in cell wall biosynthesis
MNTTLVLKPRVLVIGPSRKSKVGGIATHIRNLSKSETITQKFELFELDLAPEKESLAEHIKVWTEFIFSCRDYDILYFNVSNGGSLYRKSLAILCSRFMGQKNNIVHIHGSGFETNLINSKTQRSIFRILAGCAKKVIVLHAFAKTSLSNYTNVEIVVVHNTSADFFLAPRSTSLFGDSLQHLVSRKIKFGLFVGEVSKRKGVQDLIDVWENVFLLTDFHLLVAGNQPSDIKENINSDISKLTQIGIHYLGSIPNESIPHLLEKCEFMILPSYAEGQPISLIEGMSMKVPFVATNLPGIVELDPKNLFSFLVEPGNKMDLQKAILGMIERVNLDQMQYDDIRRSWESEFSPDKSYSKLVELFEETFNSLPQ